MTLKPWHIVIAVLVLLLIGFFIGKAVQKNKSTLTTTTTTTAPAVTVPVAPSNTPPATN